LAARVRLDSVRVRKLVLLTSAVVFVDTLFFAVLTPLLPHFAHTLGLGKTGAGVLSAAYPAGAFVGAVPSGLVAARAGVKRTAIAGLLVVALCTAAFGIAHEPWQLDLARFAQGVASAFSWTGALGWIVARAPAERRGQLIGQVFAAAVAGALFGPVVGAVASFAGIGVTFGTVAAASLALVGWAALTPGEHSPAPQGARVFFRTVADRRMIFAGWFVVLPALLFGTLSVLAPLRLSTLGFGAAAIGAVFLCSAAFEAANNVFLGRVSDRRGPLTPVLGGLAASIVVSALLPWPHHGPLLAVLVVCGGIAFGTFFTPGMSLLADLSEQRGIQPGYTSALINLAWAPGQTLGAAGGGALAHATRDAVPYLTLSAVCALTLATVWPLRGSTSWTMRSAPPSNAPSSRTTAGA
jgi:MFS family permease